MVNTIVLLCCAYLIGALPTAALCAWYVRGIDITHYGSGNSGATNAARVLGPFYFFLVLLIDVCKALYFLRFLYAVNVDWHIIYLAALLLIIGNSFSVFLKGRGGKGVATSIGVLAACCGPVLFPLFFIWGICALIWKNVGLASVISVVCLPFIGYLVAPLYMLPLMLFISLWILYRHAENIYSFLAY